MATANCRDERLAAWEVLLGRANTHTGLLGDAVCGRPRNSFIHRNASSRIDFEAMKLVTQSC